MNGSVKLRAGNWVEVSLTGSYLRLGNIYGQSGRYDEALANLTGALKVNPRSASAQMFTGVIYERKGDIARRGEGIRGVVGVEPTVCPCREQPGAALLRAGRRQKALRLAQAAKESAPDPPHISDTLGWILYKGGVSQGAVGLLRQSATKCPEHPVIQYRLGLASAVGDKEGARKALTRTTNSAGTFPGKDDAKKALAELG